MALYTPCHIHINKNWSITCFTGKYVGTGNEKSKPIWNKFIIRKDIIETSQVVLNFCRTWTISVLVSVGYSTLFLQWILTDSRLWNTAVMEYRIYHNYDNLLVYKWLSKRGFRHTILLYIRYTQWVLYRWTWKESSVMVIYFTDFCMSKLERHGSVEYEDICMDEG